ncbi:hypothetical protein LMG8526HA_00177 [Lactococcus lactis]|uniref:Gp15 family bacteriophage protein n=1 Tax=Lactococcus lactis TaxID=1358 RepID=UPI00071D2078|nr:Gp15 family bacteriophage protein [Lactococcus lactis]KSU12951.1 Phage protein [Lactococcus lactis subsp. lactis]MDU0399341.1 hypothetical protein [Lactococcus lactis]
MFSLYEELNDEHDVNGTKYPINVSFDNILNLIDMLKEKKLSDRLKLDFAIRMLFGKNTELVKLSGEEQLEIFNCVFEKYVMQGQVEKTVKYDRQGNEMPSYEADTKQNYSLKYDAEYIYASFVQAYGIDLIEYQGKLHWFKFKALLGGLPEETKFRQVLAIRTWEKPSSEKNAHEKEMKKLQEIYALPEDKEESEVD